MSYFNKMRFLHKLEDYSGKITNEQHLDVVVAGSVLIAYSDGGPTEEEKQIYLDSLQNNKSLSEFDNDKIAERFNYFVNQIKLDYKSGKQECLDVVYSVQNTPDDIDMCITVMLSIGLEYDDYSFSQKCVIQDICDTLKLNSSNYGI